MKIAVYTKLKIWYDRNAQAWVSNTTLPRYKTHAALCAAIASGLRRRPWEKEGGKA